MIVITKAMILQFIGASAVLIALLWLGMNIISMFADEVAKKVMERIDRRNEYARRQRATKTEKAA